MQPEACATQLGSRIATSYWCLCGMGVNGPYSFRPCCRRPEPLQLKPYCQRRTALNSRLRKPEARASKRIPPPPTKKISPLFSENDRVLVSGAGVTKIVMLPIIIPCFELSGLHFIFDCLFNLTLPSVGLVRIPIYPYISR